MLNLQEIMRAFATAKAIATGLKHDLSLLFTSQFVFIPKNCLAIV